MNKISFATCALALSITLASACASAAFVVRYPTSIQFKERVVVEPPEAPTPSPEQEPAQEHWIEFAQAEGLAFDESWNTLTWNGVQNNPINLSQLPTTRFPNDTPNGTIDLRFTAIGSLAGFASVKSVGGNLLLANATVGSAGGGFSQLTHVGGTVNLPANVGLPSLVSAGAMNIAASSLSQFASLRSVDGLLAILNVADLSPLANLQSAGALYISAGVPGWPGYKPIPGGSWLCDSSNKGLYADTHQYAAQWQACNLPAPTAWDAFAVERGLPYQKSWLITSWSAEAGFSGSLPAGPFPVATVNTLRIEMSSPHIPSLDGLAGIETAAEISLSGAFPNVDGLAGLRTIGSLAVSGPNLIDISGLGGVQQVNGTLYVPLSAATKPGFVRIPASSAYCNPANASQFGGYAAPGTFATQAQLCAP